MSDRSTEQLVRDLARGVRPVRPILPLRAILAAVVAVWALAVASLWLLAAPSEGFARGIRWGDPAFVAVLVGLVLLAAGATLLALAGAVPGREQVARAGGALPMLLGHALAPLVLGLALAFPIGLLVRRWGQGT